MLSAFYFYFFFDVLSSLDEIPIFNSILKSISLSIIRLHLLSREVFFADKLMRCISNAKKSPFTHRWTYWWTVELIDFWVALDITQSTEWISCGVFFFCVFIAWVADLQTLGRHTQTKNQYPSIIDHKQISCNCVSIHCQRYTMGRLCRKSIFWLDSGCLNSSYFFCFFVYARHKSYITSSSHKLSTARIDMSTAMFYSKTTVYKHKSKTEQSKIIINKMSCRVIGQGNIASHRDFYGNFNKISICGK